MERREGARWELELAPRSLTWEAWLDGPRRTGSPGLGIWTFGVRGSLESSSFIVSQIRGLLLCLLWFPTVLSSLVQGLGQTGPGDWRVCPTETSSLALPARPTGSRPGASPLTPGAPVPDEDVDTLVAQLMDEPLQAAGRGAWHPRRPPPGWPGLFPGRPVWRERWHVSRPCLASSPACAESKGGGASVGVEKVTFRAGHKSPCSSGSCGPRAARLT